MANDSFGVKMIYPNSTQNPQSWKLSGPTDSRTKSSQLADPSYSGGVISWGQGNDAARWNIMTTAGYSSGSINKNHSEIAARGYMMDPKDWRNFEATCYVKLEGNGDDQFVIYGRGGSHTGSGNCEGFAYKADLYFSGKTRFAKEQYHVSYVFTNAKSAMGSIEGKWVGMKFCCYNTNNGVMLEIWLDKNANNNWEKVDSRLDSGGFGDDGGQCGGDDDQIGTWGGPFVTFRWDNAQSVELKQVSVREIDSQGVMNEGGSNSNAGSGQGGSGNSGSGSGGSGNANSGGNPPSGSSGGTGGKADMFGVRSTYGSGQVTDKWKENFRPDGKRFDFTNLGSDNFESCELTGYFAWNDPADDETAFKMGGGNHTDGSKPKCYVLGIDLNSGATRYRLEENHPSTGGGESGPKGTAMSSKFTGFRGIKRNQSSGVLLEIWQDVGNNESAPANNWKRVASWVEKSKNWQKPPGDHQETIRIDEESGGAKDLKHKWISLREILDSDSTTPGGPSTGGGSSGGGSSGGGSSGGGSSGGGGSGGSGCGCGPGGDGNNSGGNDDDDNDSDNNTDTGEGGGITPVDPQPHITVYRDWSFYLNVGVKTVDECTQGFAQEIREPVSILNMTPDVGYFADLGYAAGQTGNVELGQIVATNQSILFDWPVKKVKVNSLFRTVAADLSTCTGNLYCEIVDTKTGVVYAQIGGPQSVAGIDTNEQALIFTQQDNEHIMKVGHAIVLRYKDASATPDKCLKIKHTGTDKYDSTNTHMIAKGPTGYKLTQYAGFDIGFEIFV